MEKTSVSAGQQQANITFYGMHLHPHLVLIRRTAKTIPNTLNPQH